MNRKIYISFLGFSLLFVFCEGNSASLKRKDDHEVASETTSEEDLAPEPKLLFPYFNGTEFWYNKHAWKYTTPTTTTTTTPATTTTTTEAAPAPGPGFFMGFAAMPHYHGSSGQMAPPGLDYDYADDSAPPKKIRPVRRRRPGSSYHPVIVFSPPKNGMYSPPYNGWAPPYPMWNFKK